jgi:WD40 repeat protein
VGRSYRGSVTGTRIFNFTCEPNPTAHPQDLETNSDSPVTAIASERGPSSVLLASFADGVIKVFDRRLEEEDAVVRSFNEHTSWVQNVRWQPHFGNQFLSARLVLDLSLRFGRLLRYSSSMSGEVKLWDIRGSDRAVETWDVFPGGLAAFDVHEQCGVFAGYGPLYALTPVMMLSMFPPGFLSCHPRAGGLIALLFIQYYARMSSPPRA